MLALSANEVYQLPQCIESIGDKELAREVIISNFMNLSTYTGWDQHGFSTCTLPSKDLLCVNLDLDLKSWFHYMAVHPTNRRRMRFNTEAYPYDEYNLDN